MYCNGALYLIDSFVCGSAVNIAFVVVVIVTSEKPSMSLDSVNELAPGSVLFVTTYSKITILPSTGFLPNKNHQNILHIFHHHFLVRNMILIHLLN